MTKDFEELMVNCAYSRSKIGNTGYFSLRNLDKSVHCIKLDHVSYFSINYLPTFLLNFLYRFFFQEKNEIRLGYARVSLIGKDNSEILKFHEVKEIPWLVQTIFYITE